MRIGILYSTWRRDEELLERAAAKRGHEVLRIAEEAALLPLAPIESERLPEVVIERCREHARALAALTWFESRGVPTVNPVAVARTCGNKVYTTGALARARVPTPPTSLAFSIDTALAAADALGYPVMLKPVVGDMGSLVARADGREEARAILEHKRALAAPQGPVFYLQRWIDRPGRDLRAFVVGGEVVAAAYFISNRAAASEDQAIVTECSLGEELVRTARAAAAAVGGGVLAVDLLESAEGLLVSEVNYTIEFARAQAALGVDIAARVIEHAERAAGATA